MSLEHLLILAIILLIFGPRRLPEASYSLGKAIRGFKDALSGVKEAEFRKVKISDKTRTEDLQSEEKKS